MTNLAQQWDDSSGSITEEDVIDLVSTHEGTEYLFDLLARTARPGRGAAPMLRALGQLARAAEIATDRGLDHWYQGTLAVEIAPHGPGITVDVTTQHGIGDGGTRERLVQRLYYAIPIDEMRWMVERVPELVAPLRARPAMGIIRIFAVRAIVAPRHPQSAEFVRADDTAKVVITPQTLLDPDSTSPVPALMAELAALLRGSDVDPQEL